MQTAQWIILKMLWTFGCSHTQGHGLPDCIGENNKPLNKTSKFSWANCLAELLNIPLNNISHAGVGVRSVWHSVVSNIDNFQENDLIVIMWPCWESRIDVLVDPAQPVNHAANIIPIRSWQAEDENYFNNYYSRYHQWQDWNLCTQHIWDLLNNKFQLINTSYEEYSEKEFNKPTWANFEFIPINFGNHKYCDMPRALDNSHNGIEAHRAFAEDLYGLLSH